MSNHTFLYSTAERTKPLARQCPEGGGLLMASYSIPVFWYMLFDEGSIVYGLSEEPDCPPYPHLTTLTAEGLARAERRWEATEHVFGRQIRALFRTWLGFVRDHALDYLHCETEEWCWMHDSTAKFEEELRVCLAAFNNIPAEGEWNAHWKLLFSQAHANRSRQLGNLSFCGFAYQFEVPWWEDTNCVTGMLSEKVRSQIVLGTDPDQLARYLETVHAPIDRVLPVVCRCGSVVFRLRASGCHGRRTCAACGASQFILKSWECWEECDAENWSCAGCGGPEGNLAIALEFTPARDCFEFLHIGVRCVGCNRLASATSGDTRLFPHELDDSTNEAWERYGDGDRLAEQGRYADALGVYRIAQSLLPASADSGYREELLGAIAVCQFRLGLWEECRRTLTERLDSDPDSVGYWGLMLGSCLHELGRPDEALEQLMASYLARGKYAFDHLEPKYRDIYRPKLVAAVTRDDYIRAVVRSSDLFLAFPDIPDEWLARACLTRSVEDSLIESMSQGVSKSGELMTDRRALAALSDALPTERIAEIYIALREAYPMREAEFRDEFEAVFARHAVALPPPFTPDELRSRLDEDRGSQSENEGVSTHPGDVPF